MGEYLKYSLADSRPCSVNVLLKEGFLFNLLVPAYSPVALNFPKKIFQSTGEIKGQTNQHVNHLKPAMVLNK